MHTCTTCIAHTETQERFTKSNELKLQACSVLYLKYSLLKQLMYAELATLACIEVHVYYKAFTRQREVNTARRM